MPRSAVVVASLALCLAACQAQSYERIVFEQDGISLRALGEWGQGRERGSLVFSGASAGHDGTTIVVRSVAVPERQRDQERRSHRQIVASTFQVLRSLPQAQVIGPIPDSHQRYHSARFSMWFQPRGKTTRYQRTHVVLVAPDQSQIVHVIHTAPEGQLEQTAAVFSAVVDSVRQEG